MTDVNRPQLRELIRTHESRLRVLELQEAQFGAHVPPHILVDIENTRAEIKRLEAQLRLDIPTIRSVRSLKQQALAAFYAKDWEKAEDLLIQLSQSSITDSEIQEMLTESQKQLDFRAFYQAICDLRDQGNITAVIEALTVLDRQNLKYPDPQRIREWVEWQQRRVKFYKQVATSLTAILKKDPTDKIAHKMLYLANYAIEGKEPIELIADSSIKELLSIVELIERSRSSIQEGLRALADDV